MRIKTFDICIADLNPHIGTETGKVRPVLVVQTNLLNEHHPSTIICPITTNVMPEAELLRVHLKRGEANLTENSDIMIDQLRAFDNTRLIKKLGELPMGSRNIVRDNLKNILDLD